MSSDQDRTFDLDMHLPRMPFVIFWRDHRAAELASDATLFIQFERGSIFHS